MYIKTFYPISPEFRRGKFGILRANIHQAESSPLQVMILKIPAGAKYPFHLHRRYDEVYVVSEGVLYVENEESILRLEASDCCFIRAGEKHRVYCDAFKGCTFVEIRPGPFDPSDTTLFEQDNE
jgi:mannose-6-phosphate isomerase-like protein (cupin superfamily)